MDQLYPPDSAIRFIRELPQMTDKGQTFLDAWIKQNVSYLDVGGDYLRAIVLAEKCVGEAATLGITLDELDPAAMSLEKIMHKAMHSSPKKA